MRRSRVQQRLEESSELIIAAYGRGESLGELAVRLECSDGAIRKLLIDHGIEIRKAGGGTPGNRRDANPPDGS
jgi:hypothetical protein